MKKKEENPPCNWNTKIGISVSGIPYACIPSRNHGKRIARNTRELKMTSKYKGELQGKQASHVPNQQEFWV